MHYSNKNIKTSKLRLNLNNLEVTDESGVDVLSQ